MGNALDIDRKTTALLVIDVLEAVGEDAVYAPSPEEGAMVANCARVVDAARAAGLPVVFCDDEHLEGVDRELELWGPHGIKGRTAPAAALGAGSGERDFMVPKRRYSGFFQTDLDLLLRELGVRTVVAVGCDTNVCVLHTLADAYFRGYDSVLVEDATRTFLCGSQEGAVEHCRKCFGSVVASTDELVAALA
ncbi:MULTISPECIES: cysteine hydrolase family protein [unclassified Olsenella]|uniref:cysteine hydrolase family protein n=1 Tax=Olsenella TaxID=133925 RepID=UPI000231EEEB|nr:MULTISPECIES: cysteine hydrolase [unclassified Olsenella]EHF01262.1 hypothetical protein HMPREF1008_01742 [Olsenella sp. oral taxon 809 str. F0356]KXB63995.1 isochorismatase family protein [Olsenella sp. DNF00959]